MSWGTCFSGSNNIHFNFPPIMNDGRNYASYQPEAIVNERIQVRNNINTNWKYRQFLTHNAGSIMNFNTEEACYTLGLPLIYQQTQHLHLMFLLCITQHLYT